jgi:hypothetical protein
VVKTYFKPAEAYMNFQWEMVQTFLDPYSIDYDTMKLACGHCRNSERLANLTQNVILVDVSLENITRCKESSVKNR